MKRLLAILLTLSLASAMIPALAKDSLSIDVIKEFDFAAPNVEMDVFTITNTNPYAVDVTITVFDEAEKKNLQTIHLTLNPGDAPLPIKARVYKPLTKKGDINLYRYIITTPGGYKNEQFYAQVRTGVNQYNEPTYTQYINSRYSNNTATSFGPHFRDVTPGLTKLWYMFTPLNLSVQGRQTYELVGSNMYVIGEVYVDVYGDTVTVTYHNYYDGKGGNTNTRQEFLGIYNSYNDVQLPNDVPVKSYINPPTKFYFGVPFSIQYDLGGDTNVIMLVRNVVDYWRFPRPENTEFRRFWENNAERKALRESMLNFMDPINYPY